MNNVSFLGNHLWQSTLFAAAVWLLTLVLRNNRASVRYLLWLAASMKFLIPFSWLVHSGSQLGWRSAAVVASAPMTAAVEQFSQPFPMTDTTALSAGGAHSLSLASILFGVWLCGVAVSAFLWVLVWVRFRADLKAGSAVGLDVPIPVVVSRTRREPGVFGIRKPVLLLPEGIARELTPAQLESIVAHELCHVRRRDNLAAAIHMGVESIFWFHPLVWWIGVRLVEERERACDEEVVSLGHEPQVYAEGILNVCKFYLQSPAACVSGVTGADLKKRIEAIVNERISHNLSFARKVLLGGAGALSLIGPVAVGVFYAPVTRAQVTAQAGTQSPVFEVASIRASDPESRRVSAGFPAGDGFKALNVTLGDLITIAYDIPCGKGSCDDRITGGPSWVYSTKFDIAAKGPEAPARVPSAVLRQRLQALLDDRFHLRVRRESKEMNVYHMVIAKGGHKLKEYIGNGNGSIRGSRLGELIAERASLNGLVANLTGMVGRPVYDQTGLKGRYDFRLEWTPDTAANAGDTSIFAALQDQLGLKLVPKNGPVDVIVIEGAEKPSAN